jgi:membrane protein DedA with SNARE-associated domain
MNILKFIIFTFIGSWIWSIGLTFAGYYSGQAWLAFADESSLIFEAITLTIIIGILGVFRIRYYTNHKFGMEKQIAMLFFLVKV